MGNWIGSACAVLFLYGVSAWLLISMGVMLLLFCCCTSGVRNAQGHTRTCECVREGSRAGRALR